MEISCGVPIRSRNSMMSTVLRKLVRSKTHGPKNDGTDGVPCRSKNEMWLRKLGRVVPCSCSNILQFCLNHAPNFVIHMSVWSSNWDDFSQNQLRPDR